jgi:hypothetical protein
MPIKDKEDRRTIMEQDKVEMQEPRPPSKDDKIIDSQDVKPEPAKPPEAPKADKLPEAPKKKPSSLTVAFRWFFILLIAFGLGVVLILFTLYLPARQELRLLSNDLQLSESEYSSNLREANQEIERLSSLEKTNNELQEEAHQNELYITLLQTRVDVLSAQISVSNGDYTKASLALSKTEDRLNKLAELLPNEQGQAIEALQTRLQLALDEIDKNDPAAESDLDVLATKLLELEDAIIR